MTMLAHVRCVHASPHACVQVALLTVEAKEARMLLDGREAQVRQLEGQVSSMQAIVQYSKQELALRARDAAELTQVKQDLLTREQKVREMKQVVSGSARSARCTRTSDVVVWGRSDAGCRLGCMGVLWNGGWVAHAGLRMHACTIRPWPCMQQNGKAHTLSMNACMWGHTGFRYVCMAQSLPMH